MTLACGGHADAGLLQHLKETGIACTMSGASEWFCLRCGLELQTEQFDTGFLLLSRRSAVIICFIMLVQTMSPALLPLSALQLMHPALHRGLRLQLPRLHLLLPAQLSPGCPHVKPPVMVLTVEQCTSRLVQQKAQLRVLLLRVAQQGGPPLPGT